MTAPWNNGVLSTVITPEPMESSEYSSVKKLKVLGSVTEVERLKEKTIISCSTRVSPPSRSSRNVIVNSSSSAAVYVLAEVSSSK